MKAGDLRFVQLQSKNVVDLENIAFVQNVELNKYIIIPRQTVAPQVPHLDAHELDEFVATLEAAGVLIKVNRLPRPEEKSKVEVATK